MNSEQTFISRLAERLGFDAASPSHTEKLLSGLGTTLGITCIFLWSQGLSLPIESRTEVASFVAASAVLLFAVPHGALSQPWPIFGGYLVSALTAIAFHLLLGDNAVLVPLTVGASVLLMYYLRCLHPPGGAVSLWVFDGLASGKIGSIETAVMYVTSCATILVVAAVLFNRIFPWRRYPATHASRLPAASSSFQYTPTQADFAAALHDLDSFIDITPEDLCYIFERAQSHSLKEQ